MIQKVCRYTKELRATGTIQTGGSNHGVILEGISEEEKENCCYGTPQVQKERLPLSPALIAMKLHVRY